MDQEQYTAKHHAFIEKFGLQFEQGGIPRMAGRIFGLLLICKPPALTPKEIMTVLDASSSSISSMMRILLQLRLVEQVSISGERAKRYRINSDGWNQLMMDRMMGILQVQDILAEGQKLLADDEPQLSERIQDMNTFYEFMRQELEQMLKKWQSKQ